MRVYLRAAARVWYMNKIMNLCVCAVHPASHARIGIISHSTRCGGVDVELVALPKCTRVKRYLAVARVVYDFGIRHRRTRTVFSICEGESCAFFAFLAFFFLFFFLGYWYAEWHRDEYCIDVSIYTVCMCNVAGLRLYAQNVQILILYALENLYEFCGNVFSTRV